MIYQLMAFLSLVSGFVKTGFGVGGGVFLTSFLSLLINTKEVVGLMTPMMLITDLTTLLMFWRKWDWSQVKLIFPGCVLGTVVGGYYLSWATPSLAALTIGIIAIVFSVFQLIKYRLPSSLSQLNFKPWHAVLISFFAGISSAIAHAGGIILTIYLVTVGLTNEAFVATLVSVLLFTDVSKFAVFIEVHILTRTLLFQGLSLTPFLLAGSFLAKKLVERLNNRQFVLYVNILVLFSGISLMITR